MTHAPRTKFTRRRDFPAWLPPDVGSPAFPAGALAQQEDWNKVIADAKKEGKLVALHGLCSARRAPRTSPTRSRRSTASPVEVLEARASEIRERVRVEQSAGRYAADVMFTSEGQTKLYDREDKTVAPLPMTPARAGVKKEFHLQVPMAAVMSIPYGILINTTHGEARRRAEDLGRCRRSEMEGQDSRRRYPRGRRRLSLVLRHLRRARRRVSQ